MTFLVFLILPLLYLPKSAVGIGEELPTQESTIPAVDNPSNVKDALWPRVLVVRAVDSGNSPPSETQSITIISYDLETGHNSKLPLKQAPSVPSLTGSIDHIICYSKASHPWFACAKHSIIWSPAYFEDPHRPTWERTYVKLDLNPESDRLMYLIPLGHLFITFLNKGSDTFKVFDLSNSSSAIEEFAVDWFTGVLAVVRLEHVRETQRILEVVKAIESVNFGNLKSNLVFQHRIPKEDLSLVGPRLTLDVDRKVLYVLYGNGSLGFVSYNEVENMTLRCLEFSNGTQVKIPVEVKKWRQTPMFAHKGYIYYISRYGNHLLRLNTKTLETEMAPAGLPKTDLKYTQLALDTSSLSHLKNTSDTCAKCSHRCFPKYPHEVACGCPIGSLDAVTGNQCLANETVVVIWTAGSSSPTLLNLLTGVKRAIDLPAILNDSSIVPQHFVKLWSPSSGLRRFCVLSRTINNTLIISCHLLENPTFFVLVPVTIPFDAEIERKVTSVTEEGNGKRWIITWIDLERRELLFRTSSKPDKTLTLYRNVVDGRRYEFSIEGSMFFYTNLHYNAFGQPQMINYNTQEPIGSKPAVNVKSLRIGNNIVTYFDVDPNVEVEDRKYLVYVRADTEESVRFVLDSHQDSEYKSQFSPTSTFGDICWIEDQRRVKCLLNSFKNVVAYQSNVRIFGIAEQTWTAPKTEVHHCFTGIHGCSHLCRPHIDKTRDIEISDPVRYEPGYTCLCPHELPVLLHGRKCTFRVTFGVNTQLPGHAQFTSVWHVTEQKIQKLPPMQLPPNVEYNFDVEANVLCWLDTDGVVCGNDFVIPGSRGAKFLLRNQFPFFSNEVYWMTEATPGGGAHKYCVFLGAANRNVSLGLGYLDVDFRLSKSQVTVDSHRKLLFWSNENKLTNLTVYLGKISENGTISSQDSFNMIHDSGYFFKLLSLNCDPFSMFVYATTKDLALFRFRYSMAADEVFRFKSAESVFRGAEFMTVNGIHLSYDQWTSEIHHANRDISLYFPLLNVSEILNENTENFDVFDIQSAYKAKELNATSPCFDATCEYFCQLVQTQHGNISKCLCPSEATVEVSDFQYCSDVQSSTFFSLAAVLLSVGLFIFVAASAVLFACLLRKKREKAHLKRVIQAFKEGDVQRAEASKDEVEKAQYLPFKAIIEAEDLIVNEIEILGEGNFGTVYQGEFSGQIVAVKTTKSDLEPKAIEDFLKELKIMEFVGDHENIVKFFGAEISKIDEGRVLVVLELCPHGNLLDYLREFDISLEKKRKNSSYTHVSESVAPLDLDDAGYKSHSFLAGKKSNLAPASSKMKRGDNLELFVYKTFTDETANCNNPYSAFDFKSLPQAASKGTESLNSHYCAFHFNSLSQKNTTEQEDSGTKVLPKVCFHWARQIAAGLEYLESKHVVHGDMAARNVLVFENDVVKVSDFGFSRKVYQYQIYQKKEACELPMRWAAPETIARREFSSKADVWSFGVTMWEIFTFGDVPFCYFEVDDEFYDKIIDGRVWLKRPKLLPEELYEKLLLPCWQLEPKQRPSFALMKNALDGVHDTSSNG